MQALYNWRQYAGDFSHERIFAKIFKKDAKILFRQAAATVAVEEGLPFHIFSRPAFRRLFNPLSPHAQEIVDISPRSVREQVITLGSYAEEALNLEMRKQKISWTSDHWTGPDQCTYTTVTAHYINPEKWVLSSACLDFKVFSGSPSGERIYNDIKSVLQRFQSSHNSDDTIVLEPVGVEINKDECAVHDVIGITDTTGSMGVLGRYLRDNKKEHGYCTDHNLHRNAILAFDRKLLWLAKL